MLFIYIGHEEVPALIHGLNDGIRVQGPHSNVYILCHAGTVVEPQGYAADEDSRDFMFLKMEDKLSDPHLHSRAAAIDPGTAARRSPG